MPVTDDVTSDNKTKFNILCPACAPELAKLQRQFLFFLIVKTNRRMKNKNGIKCIVQLQLQLKFYILIFTVL